MIFLAATAVLVESETINSENYSIESGRVGTGEIGNPHAESESYSTSGIYATRKKTIEIKFKNSVRVADGFEAEVDQKINEIEILGFYKDDDVRYDLDNLGKQDEEGEIKLKMEDLDLPDKIRVYSHNDDDTFAVVTITETKSTIFDFFRSFFGVGAEEDEEGLPKQLFDINLEIDDSIISSIRELVARVIFTSFGTEPTPVDLTFSILNETGEEVYRDEGHSVDVVVETETVFNKTFRDASDLPFGKYTLVLMTLYNVDVKDEFRAEFEIKPESKFMNILKSWWFWVIVIATALSLFLWLRKKYADNEKIDNNDKNENKKKKLKYPNSKIHKSPANYSEIVDNLKIISEYSAGLGFAISDGRIVNSYDDILKSQRDIIESISDVGDGNDQISSLLNNAIAPISNAIADIGLANATAAKLLRAGSIGDKQLELVKNTSRLALNTIKEYQKDLKESLKIIKRPGLLRIDSNISPSIRIASSGISEVMKSLIGFPDEAKPKLPGLENSKKALKIEQGDVLEHQNELDDLLREIDPNFVEIRKSSWNTFKAKNKDYIEQSIASMQRIVDRLLKKLESSEEKAKNNHEYAALKVVKEILGDCQNLSERDYSAMDKHKFIRGTFIVIESFLILCLRADKF